MADIRWYGDAVRKLIIEAATTQVEKFGAEIIAEADPPKDTSFLESSAYLRSPNVNTFDQSPTSGRYLSRRTSREEERQRAPSAADYPADGAVIGWSAIYAWYVEDKQPFAFPALDRIRNKYT